ncbi:MAG: DUF1573 domain-containing protein [Acidobacteria bacterium]|nr:DUF1573 domain-containing protein [Acidobacteriota bacterium]
MLGKHRLDPKEKTELKLTYDTAGRPGPFEKKAIVSTNVAGFVNVEIFTIKGEVQEAPAAKIAVTPRRVTLQGAERAAGKKQAFAIKNEGTLPLTVTGIRSKDGQTVYFDGASEGNITIEAGQTRTVEIQLKGKEGEKAERDYVLIDSDAKNAGESGYFLIIQYGAP